MMKFNNISQCEIIDIPTVHEYRGKLAVIERDCIPFEVKRVYYLFDVPSDAYRGGHAHKNLYQLLIPLSGSFDVVLKDGKEEKTIVLNKPTKGLLIVPGIWRELENFSAGAVCLVLASQFYNEEDYVRDYAEFQLMKR